ncbi:hypothetical protein TRAPUB_5421 [Trametes pubescens]|uniref:Histidinol-phosphatase n=1 Tax=Trametes pubescens TaxID=154538 RepID=A0A1M2V8N7_TRAPU|nr:hypothetical protein TRAPUB_5421 [Trametes pubescens]
MDPDVSPSGARHTPHPAPGKYSSRCATRFPRRALESALTRPPCILPRHPQPARRSKQPHASKASSSSGELFNVTERLKAKYVNQITLLVGLETEFITQTDMDELEGLLAASGDRVEYLVGSVHHVRGITIDFDQDTFPPQPLPY